MLKKIKSLFRRGWLVRLPSSRASFERLMSRLENNEYFSFSRWGDGEWEAVLGTRDENEANCDGHQYFSSLSDALRRVLISNPSYFLGMQKLAYHKLLGRDIDNFIRQNGIRRDWLNADAFHDASRDGVIERFFSVVRRKKVLLVGPVHLRKLEAFPFDFCEVPALNCWLKREEVMSDIRKTIAASRPEVVLFCAGMTSNWLIHELHTGFDGFLIDVGSLLDPYAGVQSRNYHKKLHLADSK